jgi:Arc/MetJ-type ribon-helix-helix transcriptional regulator
MSTRSKASAKVTIKIPAPLYQKISTLIDGAGYNSVTDFVTYVLRDLVGSQSTPGFDLRNLEKTKEKLRKLGYL